MNFSYLLRIRYWNFQRWLRLAIGILIIGSGIYAREFLLILPGFFFLGQAFLNIGCGGAACEIEEE